MHGAMLQPPLLCVGHCPAFSFQFLSFHFFLPRSPRAAPLFEEPSGGQGRGSEAEHPAVPRETQPQLAPHCPGRSWAGVQGPPSLCPALPDPRRESPGAVASQDELLPVTAGLLSSSAASANIGRQRRCEDRRVSSPREPLSLFL